MNNIVLIGMPGAGKSTVGILLSEILSKDFTDTDKLLEKKEKKPLQYIIDEKGIEEFCRIEEQVVMSLNINNTVIATGGSLVYSDKAMKKLQHNGHIIYLQLPFEVIQKRLTNYSSRGIAMAEGQSLYSLFCERIPLYEKYADFVVYCKERNVATVLTLIHSHIISAGLLSIR